MPSASTTGVAFQLTVTARNGTATDPSFTGTVHFTSSDSKATLPADYTFTSGDAGAHTFTATMGSGGSGTNTAAQTITATYVADPSVYGIGATRVSWNDDVVRQFFLRVPASVDRAVPFAVTVEALNSGYFVRSDYRGTIHFKPGRSEQVPPDYTFTASDAGTHTLPDGRRGRPVRECESAGDRLPLVQFIRPSAGLSTPISRIRSSSVRTPTSSS
jgi:hypothetical protein